LGSSGGATDAAGGGKRVAAEKVAARRKEKAGTGQKVAKKASREGMHNNSSMGTGATGEGKAAAASRAGASQKKKTALEPKLAEKAACERDRVGRQTRAERPRYRERGSSKEKTDSGAEGVARKGEKKRVIRLPRSMARHGRRTIGYARVGGTKHRKTGQEGKEGAAAMRKAAPKATVKPTSTATTGTPRLQERAQFILQDWKQREAISAWRQTEFGSGASAIMTMVEEMLEEGVLLRPVGGASEFERRVDAFEAHRAASAEVAAAGGRIGSLTEFGRGATAMITMVEAMLEEGVLERPTGKAGMEYRHRVNGFKNL
jgi:hypothetical protein